MHFTGGSLPAGSGTLATLSFDESVDGIDLSLNGVVVSSTSGATLVSDDSASTSVAACTNDDADSLCDAIDDCVGAYDDCNVCNGGNASMDDCGVCDGGNADNLGCGCFEPGPSGCDNNCGSTLVDDD